MCLQQRMKKKKELLLLLSLLMCYILLNKFETLPIPSLKFKDRYSHSHYEASIPTTPKMHYQLPQMSRESKEQFNLVHLVSCESFNGRHNKGSDRFLQERRGDRSLALLDIIKIFHRQLVTEQRHRYLRKRYLLLSAVLLEMSLSQKSRKLALKPHCKSLLSEKLTVKTFIISFVSMKINYQLEAITIDERIGGETFQARRPTVVSLFANSNYDDSYANDNFPFDSLKL